MKLIKLLLLLITLTLSSCSGCSQSGKRLRKSNSTFQKASDTSPKTKNRIDKTIVKMEKIEGVFEIPVEINGIAMSFIFDTGASIISISQTEVDFMIKQGKLSKDDFKGSTTFSDANGDISTGTLLNLKSVKIGGIELQNIEASVVHNQKAPLLFGQSALKKFGKIYIDYNNNELTLE